VTLSQLDPAYVRKYLLRRSAVLAAKIFPSCKDRRQDGSGGEPPDLGENIKATPKKKKGASTRGRFKKRYSAIASRRIGIRFC
jgi:hypothetical protein